MSMPVSTRTRRRAIERLEVEEEMGPSWSVGSIGLVVGGAVLFLSLMTFSPRHVPSWMPGVTFASSIPTADPNAAGAVGTCLAHVITHFFGAASYFLSITLIWLGVARIVTGLRILWAPVVGAVTALLGLATLLSVQTWVLQDWDITYNNKSAGGGTGYLLHHMLGNVLGSYLTGLLAVSAVVLGGIYLFGSTPQVVWAMARQYYANWQAARQERWMEEQQYALEEEKERRLEEKMLQTEDRAARKQAREELAAQRMAMKAARNTITEDELVEAPGDARYAEEVAPVTASSEPQIIDGAARKSTEEDPAARKLSLAEWRRQREAANKTERPSGMASALSPLSEAYKFYQLPDFDLLHWDESDKGVETDRGALIETQRNIVRTLASFNVSVSPSTITRGPSITRFEVVPTEGLRVKRIAELEADIARATKAEYINILAPIPGKETVGIEIANSDKVPVPLRELLEDPKFTKGKARIPLALGKDVYGETVIADLAAMPHLLVAGTTGSGKSVCINSIIASLLFQFTPDQLRFIMVDPKVVEMQIFNDLPHLIVPVVTEPKKVLAALRWCVNEMEHRYRMFANEGVRNFESFNNRKRKERSPAAGTGMAGKGPAKPPVDLGPELPLFEDLPPAPKLSSDSTNVRLHVSLGPNAAEADEHDDDAPQHVYEAGEEDTPNSVELTNVEENSVHPEVLADVDAMIEDMQANGPTVDDYYAEDDFEEKEEEVPDKVPYIVVIIDELADLMQTASADVENEIARLTQKARAAGIHLIVATQTPRANVITGVIKANIPSRIAFQVASGLDSRVILDTNGAEKLVGKGDMLYLPPGSSKHVRTQGAFITDDEIAALVQHCKDQGKPMYDTSVQRSIAEASGDEEDSQERLAPEEEEMLEKCIEVIVQERIASTSRLQRRLKLGYTRAARMMDILEARGIVGPADGIKPREILISGDDY
jgi:DNA segregation ATPase FtsK/SpoIIIE, S-DNA-T family